MTAANIIENRPWQISLIISDNLNANLLDDTVASVENRGDSGTSFTYNVISKQLSLDNLQEHENYLRLLDSKTVLAFSTNGEFLGRIDTVNPYNTIITSTENDAGTVGVVIGGCFLRYVEYFMDGRNAFTEKYSKHNWQQIDISSVAKLLYSVDDAGVGRGIPDFKDRYRVAESIAELFINNHGAILLIANEKEVMEKGLVSAISDVQPYKNTSVKNIPTSLLAQLMSAADGALVISEDGKIVFSGAEISVPVNKGVMLNKFGSRHLAFQRLIEEGYKAVMITQEGDVYPNIYSGAQIDDNERSSDEVEQHALYRVSPYYYQDQIKFFTSSFRVVDELLQFIKNNYRKDSDGSLGDVLEIGPGVGRLMQQFALISDKIEGVDISDEMVNVGKLRLTNLTNAQLHKVDGSGTLDFANESFDLVFSYGAAGFMDDAKLEKYIGESYRVLKNNGMLLLQIPNYHNPLGLFKGCDRQLALDRAKLLLRGKLHGSTDSVAPGRLGVQRSQSHMQRLMQENGFENVIIQRPSWDRIYYLVGGVKLAADSDASESVAGTGADENQSAGE